MRTMADTIRSDVGFISNRARRITKLEEALGVVATGTITMNGFLAHPSIALSILSDTARKALEGQGERT